MIKIQAVLNAVLNDVLNDQGRVPFPKGSRKRLTVFLFGLDLGRVGSSVDSFFRKTMGKPIGKWWFNGVLMGFYGDDYPLVMTNIAVENSAMLLIGKSIIDQ